MVSTVNSVLSAVSPVPTAPATTRVSDTPLGRLTVSRSPGRTPSSASTVTTVVVASRMRPPMAGQMLVGDADDAAGTHAAGVQATENVTERVSRLEVSSIHLPTRCAWPREVQPKPVTSTCWMP